MGTRAKTHERKRPHRMDPLWKIKMRTKGTRVKLTKIVR